MITTEDGSTHSLPTEVREHSTTKTSIYKAVSYTHLTLPTTPYV